MTLVCFATTTPDRRHHHHHRRRHHHHLPESLSEKGFSALFYPVVKAKLIATATLCFLQSETPHLNVIQTNRHSTM
jgi:hypothetical protein